MIKRAIVTGARAGIGSATAERLARDGYEVHAVDLDDSIEGRPPTGAARGYTCDVGDPSQIDEVCSAILASGPVSLLVNSAGIAEKGDAERCTIDEWERVMAVNVRGPWLFARNVLAEMRSRGHGVIINLSSTSALRPPQNRLAYSTSKAALRQVTRSIAADYGRYGIRAVAVCPGPIGTDIWDSTRPDGLTREQHEFEATRTLALNRLGTVDEVAAMIAFLASDEGAYVTGATITVDGGRTYH